MNKVYVSNVSYKTDEKTLADFFSKYGKVEVVNIVMDRMTNRPKGFCFITFENDEQANKALVANGVELDGRALRVNIAIDKPREERKSFNNRSDRPATSDRSFNRR